MSFINKMFDPTNESNVAFISLSDLAKIVPGEAYKTIKERFNDFDKEEQYFLMSFIDNTMYFKIIDRDECDKIDSKRVSHTDVLHTLLFADRCRCIETDSNTPNREYDWAASMLLKDNDLKNRLRENINEKKSKRLNNH